MTAQKLLKISFWAFLLSVPFGYRVLIGHFTPGFDEHEAVFLYAGDILLAGFLFLFFRERYSQILKNLRIALRGAGISGAALAAFLVLAGISVLAAPYRLLALYGFGRLLFLVVMALAVGSVLKSGVVELRKILAVIAGLAVFESVVGFLQTAGQKSLGLWFLGEPFLGDGVPGVAKIDAGGAYFMRAYGTFPHPNILAAFLLLGLFAVYYFWLKRSPAEIFNEPWRHLGNRIIVGGCLFLVLLGLTLTFSRTAWLIAFIFTALSLVYFWIARFNRLEILRLFALLVISGLILINMFGWLIFPRAHISTSEDAVTQRLTYTDLGLKLVKERPFGVGIGNQVIYSVRNNVYQGLGMDRVWQWQPVHNIYLLIGSELGILGLIAFVLFASALLIPNFKTLISNKVPKLEIRNLELGISLMMLLALLGFGFFDHFLWTIQPGRLMLWLIIGLMWGMRLHSSKDRAQPSDLPAESPRS